jgi:hypothetical protein
MQPEPKHTSSRLARVLELSQLATRQAVATRTGKRPRRDEARHVANELAKIVAARANTN